MELNYPIGFYPVEMGESPTFYYFDHNYSTVPEMNFNDYIYYYSQEGVLNNLHLVEYDEMRDIVAKPKERQHRMNRLMMVNEDEVFYPAHLPNINDVVAKPNVQRAIEVLESQEQPVYEGTTPIIPKLLVNLMDPRPVIPREGPIYTLTLNNCTSNFGSYTDQVQFLKVGCEMTSIFFRVIRDQFLVEDPSSRYQSITLMPEHEAESSESRNKIVEKWGTIVLWNGRRITRPSFIVHFREIIQTHNPMFMIITEVGAQYTHCVRVLQNLGTTLCWEIDEGKGLFGGTVVIWDLTRIKCTVQIAEDGRTDLRVVGSIKPVEMDP